MKSKRVLIPSAETQSLAKPDMTKIKELLDTASFLSVYGLKDDPIFVEDSAMYANLLGSRHTLRYVPGGDHNFYDINKITGERISYNMDVANIIAEWLSSESRRERFAKITSLTRNISRFKDIDGVLNFRDLGGWPSEKYPDRSIRSGLVFRSASLNAIKESSKKKLTDLGITRAFDLRSVAECSQNGVYVIDGVERIHLPVEKKPDQLLKPSSINNHIIETGLEGYQSLYQEILQEGKVAYRTILEHILDFPNDPFVVHCTAGKDRTGIICALILDLCGVNREVTAR